MNNLFFRPLILLSFWIPAQGQAASIPQETYGILGTFQVNGQALSAQQTQEIPEKIHSMILEGERRFLRSTGGQCKENITVTFGQKVLEGSDAVLSAFESGLVRIEASKCFDNADPQELIRISAHPQFKKLAFPTLRSISTPQEGISCETTVAQTIGQSQYCYLSVDLEKRSDAASQTSFLVANKLDLDAPVFFREAYVSARKMGGQTLYYVHSYVRAKDMNVLQKTFAKGYIQKVQEQVFMKLENSLGKPDFK